MNEAPSVANDPLEAEAGPPPLAVFRPTRIAVHQDGCLYDEDSGEVLDLEILAHLGGVIEETLDLDAKARFECDTRDKAEWALEIRAETIARREALKARLAAVTRNIQAQIREEDRRLGWWDYRFLPSLIRLSRSMLTGKLRTARFDFGSVSFRRKPPRPQLANEGEALAWMKIWRPDKVKTKYDEWVNATDVAKARDEVALEIEDEDLHLPFLKFTEETEDVTVKTGVEPGKGEDGAD